MLCPSEFSLPCTKKPELLRVSVASANQFTRGWIPSDRSRHPYACSSALG